MIKSVFIKNILSKTFKLIKRNCYTEVAPAPKILTPILYTSAISISSFLLAREMTSRRQKLGYTYNQNRMPAPLYRSHSNYLYKTIDYLRNMPEHSRTLSVLLGINTAAFIGWKAAPQLMTKHFTHCAFTRKNYTLITSMFSHYNSAHFLFNMFALWSFGGVLHQHLGREYFLAFYLTTGCSASLVSHLFNTAIRSPVYSLGASGALFGLVGLVYDRFPEASLAFFVFNSI